MDVAEMRISRSDSCNRPQNFYELFRCGVCGKPWEEHTDECSEHGHRESYLSLKREIDPSSKMTLEQLKHVFMNI